MIVSISISIKKNPRQGMVTVIQKYLFRVLYVTSDNFFLLFLRQIIKSYVTSDQKSITTF